MKSQVVSTSVAVLALISLSCIIDVMPQSHHHNRSLIATLGHLFHPRRSNNHRARLLHPEGYGWLVVIAALMVGLIRYPIGFSNDSGFILGYASDISVDQVIAGTNKERQTAGLQPLDQNERLAAAAQAKGNDMFANQYWAHTSNTGKEPWDFMRDASYSYRRAGENLARDFMSTPDMVAAWMASPTHRANIMNGGFSEIGVAVVNGKLDGVETTIVVQMFGTPPIGGSTAQISQQSARAQTQPAEQLGETRSDEVAETQEADTLETTGEQEVVSLTLVPETMTAESESNEPEVLAQVAAPTGTIRRAPLFSPLQLTQAVGLAVTLLILSVLVYDAAVAYSKKVVRFTSKNTAHICLFLAVSFVLLFFKSGIIQ